MSTDKLKKIGITMLVALGGYMLLNTLAKRNATVATIKNTVDNGL